MTSVFLLLQLFYFMLPAYFANMAPVFTRKILARQALVPIDHGLKIWGHPVFGKHKTLGGFIFAVWVAILVGHIQLFLYPYLKSLSLIDYSKVGILLSFLLGLGAITGDLVKSFFKRCIKYPAGRPWIPYDELDFVAGALLFAAPVYFPGWVNCLIIALFSVAGDLIVGWLGAILHIRKKKDILDFGEIFKKLVK